MNFSLRPLNICLAIPLAGLVFIVNLCARAEDIPLPIIPPAVFNITDYGAVGDGKTLNTAAIQKTIDACSAAGGGTVLVPAGDFVFGPITLASSLNLHLDQGATLLISDDIATYPLRAKRYQDCITVAGMNSHDIEISGPGVIDGQGKVWWTAFIADLKADQHTMPHRPYMTHLSGVTRLLVTGVTLQNSPMFHLAIENCTDVTIRGITIKAPFNAANTDGIDPSGWNYLITGCTIDTGDDDIAIKPTRGRTPGDKNFTVTDCTFLHGHGMSIGGGSFNGVEDLIVSNCTFNGTDSAIRIKTGRGNAGLVQNLTYENLTISNVRNPIYINDYYPERNAPKDPSTEQAEPVTERTPINKNITIRDVTITGCPNAGTIRGVPEMPVSDFSLINVNISAATGMKIYHARNIRFINSKIIAAAGKALTTYDADVTGLE
jgi:polygalacturonase